VLGLAITIPGLAPGALAPFEPILFKTPCNAIGDSFERYLSTVNVVSGKGSACARPPRKDRSWITVLFSHQHHISIRKFSVSLGLANGTYVLRSHNILVVEKCAVIFERQCRDSGMKRMRYTNQNPARVAPAVAHMCRARVRCFDRKNHARWSCFQGKDRRCEEQQLVKGGYQREIGACGVKWEEKESNRDQKCPLFVWLFLSQPI
jgi:hypothetical protein